MKQNFQLSQEVLDYIQEHENVDPFSLSFRPSPFPEVSMKTIIQQIQGRKIAIKKFPFLLRENQYLYPTKESLEQASSEMTAMFKSNLIEGKSFVDLTGGMGIDSFLLGRSFQTAMYVEPNVQLYELTKDNFRILGFSNCETINTTCESFLTSNTKQYDWAYIDPSRRIGGNRKTSIFNYEPNLVDLEEKIMHITENVLVKLSPMQDISECVDVLKCVHEIWVISVQNEVKELLLHLKNKPSLPNVNAVDLKGTAISTFSYNFNTRNAIIKTSDPKKYIYQPSAALVKCELHNRYAITNELFKLHPNTHLYTSDQLLQNFMGRTFEVLAGISLNVKAIKRVLPDMKANVITKNYPLSSEEITRKFKLIGGGNHYLIAFTDQDNKKRVLLCMRCI